MQKKILFGLINMMTLLLLTTPIRANNVATTIVTANALQATELIVDGGFETCIPLSVPDACADWDESSTHFGTPVCDVANCGDGGGTAGPHGGNNWAWFGGSGSAAGTSVVAQTVTIPSGSATLTWYWWVGDGGSAGDFFEVDIDGNVVFNVSGTNLASGPQASGYVQESVSLAAYADGGSHTITFTGFQGTTNLNISLDDISLIHSPVAGVSGGVAYNKINQVRITAPGTPIYESAGGNVVRNSGGNEIWVPNATAHNPYEDVYDVTDSVVIDGTTWVEIFIGSATVYVWVPLGPTVQLIN